MANQEQPIIPKPAEECDAGFEDDDEDEQIQDKDSSDELASLYKRNCHIPSSFRTWETITKSRCSGEGSPFQFKVMSYNVLAQYLLECHRYLYVNCLSHDLQWDVRASRLFTEITSYSPDILCFQEVQESYLDSFFSRFEEIGYCGIFKMRTGLRKDGCAIYFKGALFDMVNHITVEYYQPELSILGRDSVGIIVKLIPKAFQESALVVATTHLQFGSQNEDVRLAQMQLFLAEIDRFTYYNTGRESGHLPTILTGDFNSTPDGATIKLLDRGYVGVTSSRADSDWKCIGVTDNCQHFSVLLNQVQGRSTEFADIKIYNSEMSGKKPDLRIGPQPMTMAVFQGMFNGDAISHSLRLTSVYDKFTVLGSEATTYHGKWITADYIYFSCCSALKLVERLRLPTASECSVLGSLPNELYASDHLALAAVFQLEPNKST